MHDRDLQDWEHSHTFGQDVRRPGERRTLLVIAITACMMVVEIVAGLAFSSMALLADGLHMASHTAALGITAFAYVYARRHAHDPRFTFGTGKVNALAGFSGAVLLAAFAIIMAVASVERLISPATIEYDYAIFVAVLGLVVNGVAVVILSVDDADHARDGDHDHDVAPGKERDDHHGEQHHHDHNLRSAYLHVLADALTSLLAIVALLAAKYLGLTWMDPVMGIVGAILVARWSVGLLRATSGVLLDRRGPRRLREAIAKRVEADGDSRIADLHLWSIGPGVYAAEVAIVAHAPATPDEYRARIGVDSSLAHVSVEIHTCGPGPTTSALDVPRGDEGG